PAAGGFITAFPCDEPMPLASNLNFATGQTVPNAAVSKNAADGTVCIFNRGATELIVDLAGTFTGDGVSAFNPVRVLDTRNSGVPVGAGMVQVVQVAGSPGIPADATAASMTVTVTETQGAGHITVYPCGPQPTSSNLNYSGAGQTVAVAAISALSEDGEVCVYSHAGTHLIIDVNGVFSG